MSTADEVTAAAVKAGYAPSGEVMANIEETRWNPQEGIEKISLWALDTHRPQAKLFIAAFIGGKLAAYGVPEDVRSDVSLAYHIPRILRTRTGLVMTAHQYACSPSDVIVLVFTADRRFRVLSHPGPDCP
jgi:hypothetical protein